MDFKSRTFALYKRTILLKNALRISTNFKSILQIYFVQSVNLNYSNILNDCSLIHFKSFFILIFYLFHSLSLSLHSILLEPFHSTLDSVIKANSNNINSVIKSTTNASKLSENSSLNNFSDDIKAKIENDLYNQLKNEIWFHGPISRKESEILVYQDGDFLVRQSQGSTGQFVLTGMQDGIRKHLLLVDPEGIVSLNIFKSRTVLERTLKYLKIDFHLILTPF